VKVRLPRTVPPAYTAPERGVERLIGSGLATKCTRRRASFPATRRSVSLSTLWPHSTLVMNRFSLDGVVTVRLRLTVLVRLPEVAWRVRG
jgi:hypothetical protein